MPKIIALLAFRNEEKYLPGFFAHLRNYVSEFIVLDDNSNDRSLEIAQSQPRTTTITRKSEESHPDHFFEVDNRRTLLEKALTHEADWVLCCDADERYEMPFLEQLSSITGHRRVAYALRVRDLWDSNAHYRVDGLWGGKLKFVLFPATPFSDYYPSHTLHTRWPPPDIPCRRKNFLDYNIYHLLSLRREDRIARLQKFKAIDPDCRYQPKIGYDYLIDETNIAVQRIAPEHRFQLLAEDAHLLI
jgi:glycosyltransferase involved in cell wall biosynthesis